MPAKSNIPLVQIETKTTQINEEIETYVKDRFKEDFGVDVSGVDVAAIELDKTSEGYRELMSVTRDVAGAIKKAEVAAQLKDIEGNQRIEMENKAETLRIQREEQQYAMHKQTQSNNMGAFQVEKQAEVGVAGAEALGKMGENGAGGVDLGSGSTGFNPAAMMAGMAVGGAVGQNIAGTMNNMMTGVNNPQQSVVPPVVPTEEYFLAVNGQPTGPYTVDKLKEMIVSGQLTATSLLWKQGMKEWVNANTIESLKDSFVPPIPNN